MSRFDSPRLLVKRLTESAKLPARDASGTGAKMGRLSAAAAAEAPPPRARSFDRPNAASPGDRLLICSAADGAGAGGGASSGLLRAARRSASARNAAAVGAGAGAGGGAGFTSGCT